ncbi:transcription factor 23 [Falco peregrinus]|uniref:transcription factor 23 n=1 Tax=Falco peregrinus TaxID=8954 RepID=UPI002479056C|nr:transcription factor 23 [Falco peregrinus]
MAESMGCGVGPATTHGCSMATTTRSSRGRRGSSSPARAARHFWGVGAGRTPGPLSAHPGDQESPLAEGQGPPGPLCPQNAARERSRVRALRRAFLSLQAALPTVPPGTKLSKLDVLVLATSYIAHLSHVLGCGPPPTCALPPTPRTPTPAPPEEVADALPPLCRPLGGGWS